MTRKKYMLYIILLFTIIFTIITWKRLDWGVMLTFFMLPAYQVRFSVLGLPMTLLEVMVLISFFVWLFQQTHFLKIIKGEYGWRDYVAARKIRAPYPFRYEVTLIILVSYFAVIIAGFSNSALGIWKAYFFEPILMYVLVMNVFFEKSLEGKVTYNFNKAIYPLLLSGLAVSLWAIFQKFTGLFIVENFWPRVTGPFAYPNALGLYLAPLVMLTLGKITNYELRTLPTGRQVTNLKLISSFVIIILYLMAIVFASSEGALVGILAGGFIVGLLWLGVKFEKKIFYCLAKLFLVLFFAFSIIAPWFFLKVVPEHHYNNYSSGAVNFVLDKMMLKDFSGEVRKQQWRETWKMMTSNSKIFIFGTGLSGYQTHVAPYHQEGIFFNQEHDPEFRQKIVWQEGDYKAKHWRPVEIYMYPHNIFLNFWTELGLLGVLIFAWLIGRILFTALGIYRKAESERGVALGILGAMVAILIHGLVDVPYFKNDLSLMFWVMLAMFSVIWMRYKIRNFHEENIFKK